MNLLSAFLSVSGWTFVSRLLGLARDIIIAAVFGAGAFMDAFFAAFRLPNTLRRFTAEGALTQAFVPAYQAARDVDPKTAAKFAGDMFFIVVIILSIITAAVLLSAPHIIHIIAPGLPQAATAAAMLQIVFPYIVLISIVALFSGMLNTDARFRAAAAAPILLNIGMIVAALWLSPRLMPPEMALAWGVIAGGILQLLLMAICLRRANLGLHIRLRLPDRRIGAALLQMGQSALGAGAAQINLLINLAVASLLPAGAISWLYYADRLMELPAGLLGAALATVVLPALSKRGANANAILDNALRLAIVLSAPAAVGMALLAKPMIYTLFWHGAFSLHDVEMTARAVVAYSVGVVGLVILRPLAAAFFARRDAATPAKIAVAALLLTQAFNGLFVFILQWAHAGIALSIGLAATVNAAMLWWILRRRGWYVPCFGWRRLGALIGAALIAMIVFLIVALMAAQSVTELWRGAPLIRIGTLAVLVAVASGIYFAVLRAGGCPILKIMALDKN